MFINENNTRSGSILPDKLRNGNFYIHHLDEDTSNLYVGDTNEDPILLYNIKELGSTNLTTTFVEYSLTSPANYFLNTLLATVKDKRCIIKNIIITALSDQTSNFASLSIKGGTNNSITFIDDADANYTNLGLSGNQVSWEGNVLLDIDSNIIVEHNGTNNENLDLKVVIVYIPLEKGGYLEAGNEVETFDISINTLDNDTVTVYTEILSTQATNITVDWGDGNIEEIVGVFEEVESISCHDFNHTYLVPDGYNIKIYADSNLVGFGIYDTNLESINLLSIFTSIYYIDIYSIPNLTSELVDNIINQVNTISVEPAFESTVISILKSSIPTQTIDSYPTINSENARTELTTEGWSLFLDSELAAIEFSFTGDFIESMFKFSESITDIMVDYGDGNGIQTIPIGTNAYNLQNTYSSSDTYTIKLYAPITLNYANFNSDGVVIDSIILPEYYTNLIEVQIAELVTSNIIIPSYMQEIVFLSCNINSIDLSSANSIIVFYYVISPSLVSALTDSILIGLNNLNTSNGEAGIFISSVPGESAVSAPTEASTDAITALELRGWTVLVDTPPI